MPNCALKTPLYSNVALPWQCEIMKYSSIHVVHVSPSRWYVAAVWKDDESLAEPEDLRIYVSKKFHRSKILDFMRRDYPSYNWSIATLDRWTCMSPDSDFQTQTLRLRFFSDSRFF